MAQPYVGEIRMFAGNFAPNGWAFCHGQLLSIAENETLFQLIGTTYGGDAQTTFALPDLQSRIPIHQGNSFILGQAGGVETVTLTINQIPAHSHALQASQNSATSRQASGQVLAKASSQIYIADTAPAASLNQQSVLAVGGSQPHDNIQPYLCINFIISLFGIFPSQT